MRPEWAAGRLQQRGFAAAIDQYRARLRANSFVQMPMSRIAAAALNLVSRCELHGAKSGCGKLAPILITCQRGDSDKGIPR